MKEILARCDEDAGKLAIIPEAEEPSTCSPGQTCLDPIPHLCVEVALNQVIIAGGTKKRPTGTVLDVTRTAQAISKAVNGKNMVRVPAITYLKQLLAERSGSSGHLGHMLLGVELLEAVLTKGKRQNINIWEVTADDIGQLKARLVVAGRSASTIRLYLNELGALFADAVRRKVLRRNVVRQVSMPPRPKHSPRRPFADEELQRVCDLADDEWFGMIMVALYTGLRIGDVSRLVYRDFDLETSFIRANVKKTKIFEPKPIPPPLLCWCKTLKWPADLDQPLFPRAYDLVMAGKNSGLSHQFVKLLERAGVRTSGAKIRGAKREGAEKYIPLTFHCLRHNHTSMLKKGKIPEAIARRIAGHLSIAVSDVYTFLGDDITLAAVADLPEITGFPTT